MGITARLKKIRPGYRTISVLAGTAVFAGAAFFATAGANADTQGVPNTFNSYKKPTGTAATNKAAVTGAAKDHKLPNVKRATKTEYKLGKTGAPFQRKFETRIVRGTTVTDPSQHPYIIGLQTVFWELDGDEFVGWVSTCTGTVLSPTKVLTAGHCSFDSPLGTTYAIAGRSNLDDENGGFVTTVRSTFTHQGYTENDGAADNDVAVLTLTNPLPAAYTPVTLAAQGEAADAEGTSAQIVGFGATARGAGDQGILREGTVPMRSDATCSAAFGSYFNGPTMTCAGTPNTGPDVCGGDSGGPLFVTKNGVKTEVGVTSWGPTTCGTVYSAYAQVSAFSNLIKADIPRKSPNNLDWTGDGHSDLITRDSAGNLLLYSGTGLVNAYSTEAFHGEEVAWIGQGWAGFRKIFRVWNWNGDNKPSIFAVDAAGNLFQYKGDGEGGFVPNGVGQIGNGWNGFNDIMVTNNWTGNGRPNLLGRAPNGDLYLYTSNGAGGWENNGAGLKIGVGWGAFNTIITPGEWLGDGRQALIGRTPSGDLRLYQSDGQGGWVNGLGVKIGNGWNGFNIFMSPGDINGDNLVDMIGVTPAGAMRLYTTDGKGNWLGGGVGQQIGTGWQNFTAIF